MPHKDTFHFPSGKVIETADDSLKMTLMNIQKSARLLFTELDPKQPRRTGYKFRHESDNKWIVSKNRHEYCVEFIEVADGWIPVCDCPCYQDRHVCKHSEALALELRDKGGEDDG